MAAPWLPPVAPGEEVLTDFTSKYETSKFESCILPQCGVQSTQSGVTAVLATTKRLVLSTENSFRQTCCFSIFALPYNDIGKTLNCVWTDVLSVRVNESSSAIACCPNNCFEKKCEVGIEVKERIKVIHTMQHDFCCPSSQEFPRAGFQHFTIPFFSEQDGVLPDSELITNKIRWQVQPSRVVLRSF